MSSPPGCRLDEKHISGLSNETSYKTAMEVISRRDREGICQQVWSFWPRGEVRGGVPLWPVSVFCVKQLLGKVQNDSW